MPEARTPSLIAFRPKDMPAAKSVGRLLKSVFGAGLLHVRRVAGIRRGMDTVPAEIKEACRNRNRHWRPACCGPRDEACRRFRDELSNDSAGIAVLLGVEDNRTISGLTRDRLEKWVMNTCRDKIRPGIIPYFENRERGRF